RQRVALRLAPLPCGQRNPAWSVGIASAYRHPPQTTATPTDRPIRHRCDSLESLPGANQWTTCDDRSRRFARSRLSFGLLAWRSLVRTVDLLANPTRKSHRQEPLMADRRSPTQ